MSESPVPSNINTSTSSSPSLMAKINDWTIKTEDYLSKYKFMNSLHENFGISRLYLSIGLLTTIILSIYYLFGANSLCNLIGFLYPAYQTIHTLKLSNLEDHKFWCHYWLVFGLMITIESLFDDILNYFIPLFPLVKIGFYVFCFLPQTKGATIVYMNSIEPAYVNIQNLVDEPSKQK